MSRSRKILQYLIYFYVPVLTQEGKLNGIPFPTHHYHACQVRHLQSKTYY